MAACDTKNNVAPYPALAPIFNSSTSGEKVHFLAAFSSVNLYLQNYVGEGCHSRLLGASARRHTEFTELNAE